MVLEFLKYAYFNMTKGDSMNDILVKCAEKAYLDLCRTIKFNTDNRGTRKVQSEKSVKCSSMNMTFWRMP